MVAYFDYRPGLRRHRDEIDRAIARVLDSGQLVLGPEVAAFEREFAEYVGSPHAVAVGSGTDALVLALKALGIGPGDEVITVANAGVPPVAAIRASGATPRFVDVQADSHVMDPDLLGAAITGRTLPKQAAILATLSAMLVSDFVLSKIYGYPFLSATSFFIYAAFALQTVL